MTTNTPADEPLSTLRTATVWMIAAGEIERIMYAPLYELVEARAAALRRFSSLAAAASAVDALAAPLYDDGYLIFDGYRYEVLIQGEPVDLTARELKLLAAFIERRGATLTYDEIADVLWGHDGERKVADIHTYISHLRRKLEPDPTRPRYLITRRGVGYRFDTQG